MINNDALLFHDHVSVEVQCAWSKTSDYTWHERCTRATRYVDDDGVIVGVFRLLKNQEKILRPSSTVIEPAQCDSFCD